METSSFPLAEIADAQNESNIFAFDRGCIGRHLTRLQRIYATKCAQLEAFYFFFDEGQPDIVLRSGTGKELALRLPAGSQVGDIYSNLRDALDSELRELERQIVLAHQEVERDAYETQLCGHTSNGKPDYVPAILALCVPVAPNATHSTSETADVLVNLFHSTAA
ncbi:hypothetical protein BEN47_05060 [Hymenobacter lapidarius]|uniref:Uncharacterized protein n=1 Tax=Hymenobacter lapidarius TaxID=1908237 RepID=A0A1G1STS8_9BACT|nr:hypothetical protein [Hymenobacter lapidarius]OGX81991.1 hypothetical protein BEN47_05060 [Hymenobacter lapidarius]